MCIFVHMWIGETVRLARFCAAFRLRMGETVRMSQFSAASGFATKWAFANDVFECGWWAFGFC